MFEKLSEKRGDLSGGTICLSTSYIPRSVFATTPTAHQKELIFALKGDGPHLTKLLLHYVYTFPL